MKKAFNPMEGVVSDLRVVELGGGVAGAYCGKLLAGLGAEVVKVGGRISAHWDTGKKRPDGDVGVLLEQADIIIDSAGALRAEQVRKEQIVVAVSWYGRTGPYRDFKASELTAFAMSGYAYLTGTPDREPLRPSFDLAQTQGGLHAATGAMAALMYRDATGMGQLVDVAIVEAACFAHGAMAPYLNLGVVYKRAGTRNLNFNPKYQYPSVTLPCKDGHVHVHFAPSDPQLLALLMEEPRLADPDLWAAPMGHADEFDNLCLPWLARYEKKEVVRRAQELRHPFTEVLNVAELFQDEQMIARGMLVDIEGVTHVGPPVRPEAAPWRMERAPRVRKHNATLPLRGAEGEEEIWRGGANLDRPSRLPRPLTGGLARTDGRPLTGVRILDLTIVVAGPVGAGVLGDLGAEVIKIEHLIARRDVSDALPMAPGVTEDRPWNRSSWFFDLNRSKKGIALNLSVPEAKEAFLQLVALSDVVMENFSPRVMPNLGLEYETLRGVNPDVIMVSMPGFGSSGPMRDRTAFGPGIEATTGLADLTGYLDGPPLKPGNYVTDYNAAMLAAFTIMAAIHYRRRTGRGQRVEVALREGALQMIGEQVMEYASTGRVPARMGNRHPSMAPHGVYPCSGEDRWIAVAAGSDEEWRALAAVMGMDDRRFETVAGRIERQDELDEAVGAWTSGWDAYELMHRLQGIGLDAGVALTTRDIAEDPHYRERGFIQEVELSEAGRARYSRYGFQLSRTPVHTGAGPGFGEHNHAVLHDLLGFSEGMLARLMEKKAIADRPLAPSELGR